MAFNVAPSILAADFLHLEKDIRLINDNDAIIHLDVMDGSFVPNISFGFSVIDHVAKIASVPMDVHLMVVHPERWFERIAELGVTMCSFHYEAAGRNTSRYIKQIQSLGMKAGVVINPDVPVEKLYPYIGKADYFLVMSVFAGFGGQKFIYESLDRIAKLKKAIVRKGADALIEVDGGVGFGNIAALKEAGVDIAIAGSTVFNAADPAEAIRTLRDAR